MNKVKALHILVDQEHEAQDLIKKLNEGVEFTELAKNYSNCPSSQSGGSLGEFGKGQMVAPFEKAAFSLNVDEVSAPVKTQFGYHLIKRIG